ncbi:Transmembrane emp24 domain-containing protein p24beta3 [Glycine soja]
MYVIGYDIFWSPDHPGIDFTVTSPRGNLAYSLKGTSGGKFQFKTSEWNIQVLLSQPCFNARDCIFLHSRWSHPKDEHLDPINMNIAELREALESIISEQKYLKARDARHRHTSESTRKRVVFYTILEYVLFAATSLLQVVYIRRLFSKSFAYNRV